MFRRPKLTAASDRSGKDDCSVCANRDFDPGDELFSREWKSGQTVT